jgi:hypothetical protein
MGIQIERKSIKMDGSSDKRSCSNQKTTMERHCFCKKYIIDIEFSSRWQKTGNDKMPKRKISYKIKEKISQKEIYLSIGKRKN